MAMCHWPVVLFIFCSFFCIGVNECSLDRDYHMFIYGIALSTVRISVTLYLWQFMLFVCRTNSNYLYLPRWLHIWFLFNRPIFLKFL